MPYDSEATRERLVRAAIAEFAAHGLAGGRVDRIAAAAPANKRAIYDYFGNKEGLFDVAVTRVIAELNLTVPLTPDDLPGYAATLFDYLRDHPAAVRILAWRRLELPDAGPRIGDVFRRAIADVHDPSIGSLHLVVLMIGLANAWQLSGEELLAATGGDPAGDATIVHQRAAVVEAARRIGSAS